MRGDRRQTDRLPVGFYVHQVVDEELHRCFVMNMSPGGVYLERVLTPMARHSNTVQVGIPLPGTGDSVWARGEIVRDWFDVLFHGTGLRFTAMAKRHRLLLTEWLHEEWRTCLGEVHWAPPELAWDDPEEAVSGVQPRHSYWRTKRPPALESPDQPLNRGVA